MATSDMPVLPVHPEVRYERSDIHSGPVIVAGAAILFGTWIVLAVLYYFYAGLGAEHAALNAPAPERAIGRVQVPPEPRLETSPTRNIGELRAYEDAQLNGYFWADKQHSAVTIPIDRAMELIAQRGIPPQKAPAGLELPIPQAGTRRTGFEGHVEPEPR